MLLWSAGNEPIMSVIGRLQQPRHSKWVNVRFYPYEVVSFLTGEVITWAFLYFIPITLIASCVQMSNNIASVASVSASTENSRLCHRHRQKFQCWCVLLAYFSTFFIKQIHWVSLVLFVNLLMLFGKHYFLLRNLSFIVRFHNYVINHYKLENSSWHEIELLQLLSFPVWCVRCDIFRKWVLHTTVYLIFVLILQRQCSSLPSTLIL